MSEFHSLTAKAIDGSTRSLGDFAGKAVLVVNVASKCGFTPQYRGLEDLYQKYRARGFEILGFPCDQFGHQEPGSEEEIRNFCTLNFGVTFPMFAKVEVNGKGAHPLFEHLKKAAPGVLGSESIKWNFTKFLVAPDGRVVERFAPATAPADIGGAIEAVLPVLT